MKRSHFFWFVSLAMAVYPVACVEVASFHNEEDDIDFEPEPDYEISLHPNEMPEKFSLMALPRSPKISFNDEEMQGPTTECVTPLPNDEPTQTEDEFSMATSTEQQSPPSPQATPSSTETAANTISSAEQESKAKELRNLVQHLYIAQARVQLEATEIKKAQAVANSAQQALEDAANHVRAITASLQNSQQEVASAAIRAQTAQLQLAAHDQLLFAARQDVDALSSQMVGLQAQEGISQPKITVDVLDLLEKLKKPLEESEKPTSVPQLVPLSTRPASKVNFSKSHHQQSHVWPRFRDIYLE